jgi:hypothetical protein
MPSAPEFDYLVYERGYVRDKVVLANFRGGLRNQKNPETGQPFTEDEIQRATQTGSRWYNEAQAVDDKAQLDQRNALILQDNARIDACNTFWLRERHAKDWDLPPLGASPGTGTVVVSAPAGTVVKGSTTIGDITAYWARDAAGKKYQVTATVTVATGKASVVATLIAMDGGADTNPRGGDVLTWGTRDPAMAPACTVGRLTDAGDLATDVDFAGGYDAESDAEYQSRLLAEIRHKQGAGNSAQMRSWVRKADVAIEDAFIYPCAWGNGTTLIICTVRRPKGSTAPTARFPTLAIINKVIARMTPPGSPIVPANPHIVVVGLASNGSLVQDVALRLGLPSGSRGGWTDAIPFPTLQASPSTASSWPHITAINTVGSEIRYTMSVTNDNVAPIGLPALMFFHSGVGRFIKLQVASVVSFVPTSSCVFTLAAAPEVPLIVGSVICPDTELRDSIGLGARGFFDSLGPFEAVNQSNPVWPRAQRFPPAEEEFPYRFGGGMSSFVSEAIGGNSDVQVDYPISTPSPPTPPAAMVDYLQILTLGYLGAYPY